MKYANIRVDGADRVAIQTEHGLACLPEHIRGRRITSVEDIIRELTAEASKDFVQGLEESFAGVTPLRGHEVVYRPVVEHPSKILCIGLNYHKHAQETGLGTPSAVPVIFGVFNNTLAAHEETIPLPSNSSQVDYEVELAIVIGRRCCNVERADALAHVFGYSVANDISARDLQNLTSQWLAGKSLDRFCPIGPYLVTPNEIDDPNDLNIQLMLNGEMRQNANTSDMIFSCEAIIEYLSSIWTLEPGDVILTGTPDGVILGYPESERVWIGPHDRTDAYVEKIGLLTNAFSKTEGHQELANSQTQPIE